MLSALQLVGACLLILAVVFGSIVLVMSILVRIKEIVRPPVEAGPRPWRPGLRHSLAALVRDARVRPHRFWLTVAIVFACVYFAPYIVLGLMALGLLSFAFQPFARRYNWGSEGRLTRHVSRPPFEDESRRATQ